MRLRVCSLLLLFMALSIDADKAQETLGGKPSIPETPHEKEKVQEPKEEKKTVPASEPNTSAEETNKTQENLPPPVIPKKVLIYNPYIGYYHTKFMATIANELHAAGHQVTMLDSIVDKSFDPAERHEDIKVYEVDQNPNTAEIMQNGNKLDSGLKAFWDDLSPTSQLLGFISFYKRKSNFAPMMAHQCGDVLNSDDFKEISETKFDLAITEVFDLCGAGIFHLLKPARTMLASSVPLHEHLGEILGLPKTFDVVPTKFSISTAANYRNGFAEFTFRGFVKNAMESAIFGQEMFGYLETEMANVFKKNGFILPKFKDILRSAHSLIENVHPLLDLSKPTLNSIIPIGGITAQNASFVSNEKAEETAKILAEIRAERNANKKIVLISFGTVMKTTTMKEETKKNLIKAFKNVPETTFYWKANMEDLDGIEIPTNLKIHGWLQQNDLLSSGTIDLFVSHMGIGSMTEAAYSGVPLVAIPLFVDQHYNYICARRLGIARHVDKATLAKDADGLSKAINDALVDEDQKNKSTALKEQLNAFGNQTKKMMDHINFTLSLPADSASMAFLNHHKGFEFDLSFRSLFHLVPRYSISVGLFALAAGLVWLTGIFFLYLFCCGRCRAVIPFPPTVVNFLQVTWLSVVIYVVILLFVGILALVIPSILKLDLPIFVDYFSYIVDHFLVPYWLHLLVPIVVIVLSTPVIDHCFYQAHLTNTVFGNWKILAVPVSTVTVSLIVIAIVVLLSLY